MYCYLEYIPDVTDEVTVRQPLQILDLIFEKLQRFPVLLKNCRAIHALSLQQISVQMGSRLWIAPGSIYHIYSARKLAPNSINRSVPSSAELIERLQVIICILPFSISAPESRGLAQINEIHQSLRVRRPFPPRPLLLWSVPDLVFRGICVVEKLKVREAKYCKSKATQYPRILP